MNDNILKGIKNIVFDFGCVIVDLDKQKCIEALERIGAGEIAHYVDECKQIDMFLDLELGRIDVAKFCREIRLRAPGCTASDKEISEAWGELLTGIPVHRLEKIERLHEKYNIYLLSNSNPVHWEKSVQQFFPLSGHTPDYYFDKKFISYKMGLTKPDLRIFTALLEETGAVADETLFIDDSINNCMAAEELGIHTLHVKNGDEWGALLHEPSENYDKDSVATIGFFDGVHCGHRFLIEQVKEDAKANGLRSMVITFDRHPRQVLRSDYQPQMLSTLPEKVEKILQTGVDRCEVLPFNEETASLTAYQFMKSVLKERFGVKRLIIGYDNRFGHNRSEGFDEYVEYGKQLGIDVIRAEAFVLNGVNVSSSVARAFLSEGEIEMATACLGYSYSLSAKVVSGVQEGRKMGFPTANLDIRNMQKLIPAHGAYAVIASLEDGTRHPAMMNIGTRPTFNGGTTTMEVNILDFCGNLYGCTLKVTFVKRLRGEKRFESEKALMRQLEKDKENTLICLKDKI